MLLVVAVFSFVIISQVIGLEDRLLDYLLCSLELHDE